ncbi:hypothetical protein [Xanthomonas massiliensis]|uniref:hypothetical protein n=1 Tax=Xanthomonas massiliensis TaxID=1720302 RepID=UPI000AE3FEC4
MRSFHPWMLASLLASPLAAAQDAGDPGKNRVIVVENVKFDYAQVLNVEPVYQTLRASRTEEQCDPPPAPPRGGMPPPAPREDEGRLSRAVDTVKGWFGGRPAAPEPAPPPPPASGTPRNCRIVEIGREFRRPIAYDVDYVYKGTKYRSRLPEDPGNRLRVRVTVAPYVPDAVIVPPR